MFTIEGKYTNALVTIDQVEEACVNQIYTAVNHPAFTNPIAIMIDTHAGNSGPVGFTMPITDRIVPNVVGVDIGCAILAVRLDCRDVDVKKVDKLIQKAIPTGFDTHNEGVATRTEMDDLYNKVNLSIRSIEGRFGPSGQIVDEGWFHMLCKKIGMDPLRATGSLGTLGGGNHFVEVGVDDTGYHWLMVHSGSRKLGESVCRYHQNIAKAALDHKRNTELRSRIEEIQKTSPHREVATRIAEAKSVLGLSGSDMAGLEYLEGDLARNYLVDMAFAQAYAHVNRKVMVRLILENALKGSRIEETIESVHNYVDMDDMIIRKGAIASYIGRKMVVPLNMRDGTLICEGKSNPDWNHSSPHGAGRLMSRTAAKSTLNLDEALAGMAAAGVYTTSLNRNSLDEAPGAYKDSAMIERAIAPTATVLGRIRPILNIKDCGAGASWKEKRAAKKDREKNRNRELDERAYAKMKKIR